MIKQMPDNKNIFNKWKFEEDPNKTFIKIGLDYSIPPNFEFLDKLDEYVKNKLKTRK